MSRNATTLTVPTIHLNGSGAGQLREDYIAAIEAVDAAIKATMATSPHGRDYYVQPTGAFEAARDQHASRLARLLTVKDEFEALARSVSDQQRAREVRRAG